MRRLKATQCVGCGAPGPHKLRGPLPPFTEAGWYNNKWYQANGNLRGARGAPRPEKKRQQGALGHSVGRIGRYLLAVMLCLLLLMPSQEGTPDAEIAANCRADVWV